jgi:hypothetical protein
MVATHEHACSARFSTCPQLTGEDGERGEPNNPNPTTPRSTAPENLRAGITLIEDVHQGMLGPELHTTKSKHGPPVASSDWGSIPSTLTLSTPVAHQR